MINKKNLLGKVPLELGDKDAIHVAIVAVRAAKPLLPGQGIQLNKDREAVSGNLGVADPFLKGNIVRGQVFWMILNQDAVPNVQHVWEHPTVDFSPPTTSVARGNGFVNYANILGLTCEQLLDACQFVIDNDRPAPYVGIHSAERLQEVLSEEIELYDLYYDWTDESGHEFPNDGTECCPEYQYPEFIF